MIIRKAAFLQSNTKVDKLPAANKPEYAFIGRSNVGKSSLINMLTNKKQLAKTSSTPGKTITINHFIINDEWYLVDLPGYGYAKASKNVLSKLDKMIRDYVNLSPKLVNLFVLIDSRHALQAIDLEFMQMLGEAGIPYARLHDIGMSGYSRKWVDIHHVFPDFAADPTDPGIYGLTEVPAYADVLTLEALKPSLVSLWF